MMIDHELRTFQTYDLYTQKDGTIAGLVTTNDDDDDGWPDGDTVSWRTAYKSRDLAARMVGVSRTGISGIRVSVLLDGRQITSKEQWLEKGESNGRCRVHLP